MTLLVHKLLNRHIGACLVWILWALPADALSGPAYITLHERVEALRPELRLGDIARVESANPEEQRALAAIPVCYAPTAGAVRTVTHEYLLRKLRQQGIELDHVTVVGAKSVAITTTEAVIPGDEIERRILEALKKRLPWDAADVDIIPPKVVNDMVVPMAGATIDVDIPAQEPLYGSTLVHVRVFAADQLVNQVSYRFHVARYERVLVARDGTPRDTILESEHLMPRKVDVSGLDGRYVTAPEEVVGTRLVRTLKPGMRITPDMVEMPPVVRRGDRVRVRVSNEAFEISTYGKALDEGAVDAVIEVELQERRRVLVRITGPAEARLVE